MVISYILLNGIKTPTVTATRHKKAYWELLG